MKYLTMLALGCFLVQANTVHAQTIDPFDNVLVVSKLTEQQEAQFSATDGAVSPFWSQLDGDYIELLAPDDCATGLCNFTGDDDGAMLIKAAGTTRGLYIYAAVQDNVWVDRSSPDACCDDSVDLYLDKLSSNDIATCTDCLVGLYSSSLSFTTQQIQVSMGSANAPSDFRFACYDENLWTWQTASLTYAQAKSLYGFEVEAVTVDPTHKVQEWFFPWERFGGGIPVGTDIGGMQLGFAGGYNDKDGDNTTADQLRWPEAGDPWKDKAVANYWGDLFVPADMGAVVAAVPIRRPLVDRRAARGVLNSLPVERFTLTGKRISRGQRTGQLARGVVVEGVAGSSQARVRAALR
jgi:hypothetical protein